MVYPSSLVDLFQRAEKECWTYAALKERLSVIDKEFKTGEKLQREYFAYNELKSALFHEVDVFKTTLAYEYKNIILVFALGMIIHWLPDRFKRLYRYVFANFALPIQIILTALSVFLIYQFMSADSQPFIYFQF